MVKLHLMQILLAAEILHMRAAEAAEHTFHQAKVGHLAAEEQPMAET